MSKFFKAKTYDCNFIYINVDKIIFFKKNMDGTGFFRIDGINDNVGVYDYVIDEFITEQNKVTD